jgi:BMFP domain-containing protein YqiC
MQNSNRFFDDLAKMANGAVSVATGMRQEVEQMVRQQFERFLSDRDLVSRDEFDAVRVMAEKARAENEALAARLAALETAAKPKTTTAKKTASRTTAKTATTRQRKPKTAD